MAAVSAIYIGSCFIQEKEVAKIYIIITFLMLLQGILEYLVTDAIYTLPLVLILGICIGVCPVKKEPLQWTFVTNIVEKVKVSASEIYAKVDYWKNQKMVTAGFSTTPSFAGGIKDNDIEQLCLIGDIKETGMYVCGGIYNTYTEEGWRNQMTLGDYNENGWNYVQLLTFLKNEELTKEQAAEICKRKKYKVMYKTIYTKTAFTFLNTVGYQSERDVKYSYENGCAIFEKPKKHGFSYKITYIDINYGSDSLQEMFRQLEKSKYHTYSYEELCQLSKDYFAIDMTTVIQKEEYEKADREQVIADNYLDIPDHIPERVKQLAEEITKDCQSDYEKMTAIAKYLHQFKYNTQPAEMKGECVIDSFLFDVKEGYCTYFASAMVLLCRSVDIPARYVSGFYLGEDSKSTADTYHARGNNAHAWAECYIEGYGFLPIEATPGYYATTMQQWQQKQTDRVVSNYIPTTQQPISSSEEHLKQHTTNETTEAVKKHISPAFVAAGTLVVISIVFVFVIWLLLCLKKYKSVEITKQCQFLWYLQLQMLAKQGCGIKTGETLREYEKRLQKEEVTECIAVYEQLKYGDKVCGIKEKQVFYCGLQQCKQLMRGGSAWLVWYFMMGVSRYLFTHNKITLS